MTSTKTGTEAMIRTSQSVSIFSACVGGLRREPVDQQPEARCRAATRRRRSRIELADVAACSRRGSCTAPRLGHQRSRPMDAASYRSAGTEGTDAAPIGARGEPALGGRGAARRRPGGAGRRWPGSPTARRRDGGGTPWRTGPAGGSRRGARPRGRSRCGARAARRRAPCARASGARGTSCSRSRRRRAAAGGARRRRGGRCRRARGRRRTRARRSRSRPRTGSSGAGWWRVVAWARQ